MAPAEEMAREPWWKTGVLYQIYPRSFADSDGDGVGDLPGVIAHLDHLAWLGVAGIWLSPVTPSPNADWGYDVADFCAVDPTYGTVDDVDRLVAEAGRRGIRVLMDLVPNHTSDQHPWFTESRRSRTSPRRDWYVWADPKPDGSPPNNWISSFGGPAWTLDQESGQYYLHNHLDEQPDLNWWNDEVRAAFDGIMEFWAGHGVAGYRIDVCNIIIKDALLRDNPPATEEDDLDVQLLGQRSEFNGNRPEVHDVIRRWRALAEARPEPLVLIGETPVPVEGLAAYYGGGTDELHLAFNFPFISADFEAATLRDIVEETEAALPPGAWPAWTGSNHDMSRLATRWGGGDPAKTRLGLFVLLTLRGTAVLYQGDEIGHADVPVAHEDMKDPLGVRFWPYYDGRDAMRTPMPWSGAPGAGFTSPGVTPWLPLGDTGANNVEAQRSDAGSTLYLVRDLIARRRRETDLASGSYRTLEAPAGTGAWAWARGDRHIVMANLSDAPVELAPPGPAGAITIGTDRRREGERVDTGLELGAWEGVVVRTDPPTDRTTTR